MDILDINRAIYFNKKWFTHYKWIMKFVNSNILGYEVAIAEVDGMMLLVSKDGVPITIIDNV